MGSPWKKSPTRAKPVGGGILVWKWRPVCPSENKNLTLKEGQSGRGWDPQKETISTQNNGIRSQNELDILFAHFPNDTFKGKKINFPSGRPELRPTSLVVFIREQPPSPPESLWGWGSARKVSCSPLSLPSRPSIVRELQAEKHGRVKFKRI